MRVIPQGSRRRTQESFWAGGCSCFISHVCHHHSRIDDQRFCREMRFSTFLVFSLLWSTLIYDPLADWSGELAGFFATWAHSISQAALSYTSTRAHRLW